MKEQMSSPKTWGYTFVVGSIIIGCAVLADLATVGMGRPPNIMFFHVIVVGTLLVLLAGAIVGLLAAILKLVRNILLLLIL